MVILTTSQAESDIERCYELHANAYVSKPVELDGFRRAVQDIDRFFLSVARPPSPYGD